MSEFAKLRAKLAALDDLIERWLAFEERGYDCGMMLAITQEMRDGAAKELEDAEREQH